MTPMPSLNFTPWTPHRFQLSKLEAAEILKETVAGRPIGSPAWMDDLLRQWINTSVWQTARAIRKASEESR